MHVRVFLAVCLALATVPCLAQDAPDGTPSGGQWLRTEEVDNPSNQKVVKFTLVATEAEMGRRPDIEVVCTGDSKFVRARYFADTVLSANAKNYKNYDAPALSPKLRFDKRTNFSPIWELLPDNRSALIDTRTIHDLFKSTELYVRYMDKSAAHFVDYYQPEGLDKKALERACGSNGWFEK